MEKSEMMKRYEAETGLSGSQSGEHLSEDIETVDYVRWLEAKAAAYDRLMSGDGVKTAKDAANIFGRAVASVDRDWHVFENVPVYDGYRWWDMKSRNSLDGEPIPFDIEPFNGDEANSLTLPDEWEEK